MTLPNQDCENLRELLPAYSIGATDKSETAFVEATLPTCPEVAPELADLDRVTAALYFNAPQVEPPAYLAESLMAAINPRIVTKPEPKSVRAPAWQLWAASAAAVAAVALLVVTNFYWMRQVDFLNQQQQQITAMLTFRNEVLASFTQGETKRLELVATENQAASFANVMWNPQQRLGVLVAANMPPLSPGKTYQAWLIRDQEVISCGIFQVDAEGNGLMVFDWPKADQPFESMGITTEPLGGSTAPTSSPVVVGQL